MKQIEVRLVQTRKLDKDKVDLCDICASSSLTSQRAAVDEKMLQSRNFGSSHNNSTHLGFQKF